MRWGTWFKLCILQSDGVRTSLRKSVLVYQTTRSHNASPWDSATSEFRNYIIKTSAVWETPHRSPLWRHYALDAGRNDWSSRCWLLHVRPTANCFSHKNYIKCLWRWLSEVFLIRGWQSAAVRLFLKTHPEASFSPLFFFCFSSSNCVSPRSYLRVA
jgi:hypothetical protein